MEVKIHNTPRPKVECSSCHKTFPSLLDLEEHGKYDHSSHNTTLAAQFLDPSILFLQRVFRLHHSTLVVRYGKPLALSVQSKHSTTPCPNCKNTANGKATTVTLEVYCERVTNTR